MNENHAAAPSETGATGPSFGIKLIVSILVVFHLGCIIVNVTAAGATAPPIISKLYSRHGIISGYLGSIFQTNAYRFYAPDPGPCDLLWVRFKYADPTDAKKEILATRWYEVPDRDEHALRMPYQRDLAACMLLNQYVEPVMNPETPFAQGRQLHFTDLGRIAFSSYLRHIARQPRFATLHGPEFPKPLVLVGMDAYKVAHNILNPIDVKVGLHYTDPRFYEVYALGKYEPDGTREGVSDEPFILQFMEDLFARIVQEDLLLALERKKLPANDPVLYAAFIAEMGVPKPFRRALEEDPTLVKGGQTRMQLAQRFVEATTARDNQQVKQAYGIGEQPSGSAPNLFAGSQLNIPRPTSPGQPNQSLENRISPQNRNKPGTTIK